jgi:hypothetical protein
MVPVRAARIICSVLRARLRRLLRSAFWPLGRSSDNRRESPKADGQEARGAFESRRSGASTCSRKKMTASQQLGLRRRREALSATRPKPNSEMLAGSGTAAGLMVTAMVPTSMGAS